MTSIANPFFLSLPLPASTGDALGSAAPTLGQQVRLEELILLSIGLLILIGGWIANRIREMNEARGEGEADARDETAHELEATDLDEVAMRRREQLRRAAQQRQPGGGEGSESSAQMTMAERIARARAAQQAGGQGRGGGGAAESESSQPGWEMHQRENQRRMEQREHQRRTQQEQERRVAQREAQKEAERRRLAEARRAESQAPQQPRGRARGGGRARGPGTAAVPGEIGALPPKAAQRRRAAERGQPVRRGQRPSAYDTLGTAGSVNTAEVINMLRGPSLRHAIVLKEILDRPVGLRNADDAMWT